MIDRPVIDLEDDIADLGIALGITALQIAVHHLADDIVFLHFARMAIKCRNRLAVAQNGNLVGHFADFIELVRNEDRGDALRAKLAQQRQKRRTVIFVEACCWFIEDQQPHTLGKRLGDFNKLLLANADIGDERIGRFRQTDLFQ